MTWTTFPVGDYDVSGICFGQRSQTSNRVLQPHRLVDTFRELRLLGNCAEESLTLFDVEGSEVGVSIGLAVDGLEGSTNLALADGSDTQLVAWYAEGGDERPTSPPSPSHSPRAATAGPRLRPPRTG